MRAGIVEPLDARDRWRFTHVLLREGLYVERAHHAHVHIDPDLQQWVFCRADADGAVPITIAVTQTRIDDDPEPG